MHLNDKSGQTLYISTGCLQAIDETLASQGLGEPDKTTWGPPHADQ